MTDTSRSQHGPETMEEWLEAARVFFAPLGEAGVATLTRHRRRVRRRVKRSLGEALSQYALLLAYSRGMSAFYEVKPPGDQAPKIVALRGLHWFSCVCGAELEVLVADGLEDAAFSRARTLHEARVIALLLAKEEPVRAQMFLLWRVVERNRAYWSYVRAVEAGGGTPHRLPDEQEMAHAAADARRIVRAAVAVPKAKGPYGWMASPSNPRPTFADLHGMAGLPSGRSWYVLANLSVHVDARLPEDLFNLRVPTDGDIASLADSLIFAADCVMDVARATDETVGWQKHPRLAEEGLELADGSLNPFLLAAESARRAMVASLAPFRGE